MIKKTILFFVATFISLSSWAGGKSLVVTFDNGTTQTFLLSDKPKVSVADDKLIVEAAATTMQYTLNEVKTFTFAEVSSGIDGLAAGYDITKEGDAIIVSAQVKVEAYTADGKEIGIQYTHDANRTIISLSSLPNGLSIVRVGALSVKIVR